MLHGSSHSYLIQQAYDILNTKLETKSPTLPRRSPGYLL